MDEQPMITKAAMDAAIASAVGLATKRAAQEAEASTIARLRSMPPKKRCVRTSVKSLWLRIAPLRSIDWLWMPPASI
jgi:hypothetical protein